MNTPTGRGTTSFTRRNSSLASTCSTGCPATWPTTRGPCGSTVATVHAVGRQTPLLDEETKQAFTWPRKAPANLVRMPTTSAAGRPSSMAAGWRSDGPRLDAVRACPVHDSRPLRSPRRPAALKRIVAVDAAGKERDGDRPETRKLGSRTRSRRPVEPGLQVEPPQNVQFQGLRLQFSIGTLSGDNWQVGFCRPDEIDDWRRK